MFDFDMEKVSPGVGWNVVFLFSFLGLRWILVTCSVLFLFTWQQFDPVGHRIFLIFFLTLDLGWIN